MVIEGALEGELDDHLGYGKHDPEGRDGGNSRNGRRAKTVITDTGPVEISVPRDRDSSFEPKIVAKRQRRLTGVDEMVISLSAKGLTHGEIAAHLAEVYGAEVSKQTITAITDRVMDGLAEWQSRPLDPVYAVIFIDANRGRSYTVNLTDPAKTTHQIFGRRASRGCECLAGVAQVVVMPTSA
jgi:transposase-like protein